MLQSCELTKGRRHKGPLSFLEKAKKPPGAGLVTRRELRQNENVSKATRDAYRAGYNTMWKHAGPYMRRKGFKRPGEFRSNNQHGGRLWSTRKECQMTDKSAGEIIERVYLSKKVSVQQLKQVRHSLSYSYYLKTGKGGENWPEVKAQWRSFALATLPEGKRKLIPVRIPSPKHLKRAFTKPWKAKTGVSLATFSVGLLACWDTAVFGLRPNVDVNKVKSSRDHDINPSDGYATTAMVNGRSKLHLSKRGTRPWQVFRVCTCKGTHKVIPDGQLYLRKDGNPGKRPTWNTCCPVAAMQLVRANQMETEEWRIYPKWTKAGIFGKKNVGDVSQLANEWLKHQGQTTEEGELFDHNSGRKSLARWLEHLNVPYRESVHIHGDLECVWRHSYQDRLDVSHYRTREQSTNPDLACKALRRLVKFFHGAKTKTFKEQLRAFMDGELS